MEFNNVSVPSYLEVRFINNDLGYGVFTSKSLKKDSIIEICYCLEMGEYALQNPIIDYVFYNKIRKSNILPFGYGMIYNHNEKPNIIWNITDNPNFIFFTALRDINENEELCHKYGENWFESRKKKLL